MATRNQDDPYADFYDDEDPYRPGANRPRQSGPFSTYQDAAPAAPAPAPKAKPPMQFDATTDWSDPNNVLGYFKSRGVTPNATSADYWAGKYNEWGKNDPTYFLQRLSTADEFTGGPRPGPAAAPAAAPAPQQPDPMLTALLQRITAQDKATAAQKAADQQKADALYGDLSARAHQSLAIDRNDPIIRAQADAFGANTDRSARNYLADLAEQAGPIANLQGQQRITAEHAGQAKGSFEAELMGRELTSRRAEISDALNSMRGMLSAQQQNDLQAELASLDAAIKQAGLSQAQNQFGADTAFKYAQLGQQGSQFGQQLAQNASQFGQTLGFNYENMDNDLLRLLLNGIGS